MYLDILRFGDLDDTTNKMRYVQFKFPTNKTNIFIPFWSINPFQKFEIKQSFKLKQNKTIL